jgi:hypothetical protein
MLMDLQMKQIVSRCYTEQLNLVLFSGTLLYFISCLVFYISYLLITHICLAYLLGIPAWHTCLSYLLVIPACHTCLSYLLVILFVISICHIYLSYLFLNQFPSFSFAITKITLFRMRMDKAIMKHCCHKF